YFDYYWCRSNRWFNYCIRFINTNCNYYGYLERAKCLTSTNFRYLNGGSNSFNLYWCYFGYWFFWACYLANRYCTTQCCYYGSYWCSSDRSFTTWDLFPCICRCSGYVVCG